MSAMGAGEWGHRGHLLRPTTGTAACHLKAVSICSLAMHRLNTTGHDCTLLDLQAVSICSLAMYMLRPLGLTTWRYPPLVSPPLPWSEHVVIFHTSGLRACRCPKFGVRVFESGEQGQDQACASPKPAQYGGLPQCRYLLITGVD